tara:strand:- start:1225 stop:1689 length:465 start_codon:yes stop_codon:yes gene_type:complete
MADFAEIKTSDNTVLRVVVINDSDISGKTEGEAETWVAANIANDVDVSDPYPSTYWKKTYLDAAGESAKRYNGASIGMPYDISNDAFYWTTHHHASWALDSNYQWQAPTAQPPEESLTADEVLIWNETNTRWEKRETGDLNSTDHWNGSAWVAI